MYKKNEDKLWMFLASKFPFLFTKAAFSDATVLRVLSEDFITKSEKTWNADSWKEISKHQKLSEEFIERNKDKIHWESISSSQKLSEEFIEKYKDKVYWAYISSNQRLSEEFIERHKDRVCWQYISSSQKLSEEFIEKYKDRLQWSEISFYQTLSEEFIERHKDKVRWGAILASQKLSEDFIERNKDLYGSKTKSLLPNTVDNRSKEEKLKNIKAYAKKYRLTFDGKYLYCYREHDKFNRGIFNKIITYDTKGIFRDWKCNLDDSAMNSYGLGIFPEGNVAVRVSVDDWGVWVKDTNKGRVWAFEII